MCVCVCVCVCARARARACLCACRQEMSEAMEHWINNARSKYKWPHEDSHQLIVHQHTALARRLTTQSVPNCPLRPPCASIPTYASPSPCSPLIDNHFSSGFELYILIPPEVLACCVTPIAQSCLDTRRWSTASCARSRHHF